MRLSEGTVEVEPGRRVGFAEYGVRGGPVVLLFHGYPGGRAADLSSPALAEAGVSLLSIERPGFGLSDQVPGRTLLGWADDVRSFVDAIGVARFGIVGVSGGAPYALAAARSLPDRVAAVALLCPACMQVEEPALDDLLPSSFRDQIVQYRTEPEAALAAERAQLELRSQQWSSDPNGLLEEMFAGVSIADPVESARFREKWSSVLSATYGATPGLDEFRVMCESWGFDFTEVSTPVHAWHGDADTSVPLALTEHAVASLPNAELTVCPSEGHLLSPAHHRPALNFLLGHF